MTPCFMHAFIMFAVVLTFGQVYQVLDQVMAMWMYIKMCLASMTVGVRGAIHKSVYIHVHWCSKAYVV